MKAKSKGTLIILLILVAGIFLAVTAFFNGLRQETKVVVATTAIQAGTRLDESVVTLASIPSRAVQKGALTSLDDALGQVLTMARAPGDQVTASMVGDAAVSGVAAALPPDHRAVAIHVDQASGLAGIIRVGDRVAVVGTLNPPDTMKQAAMMATTTGEESQKLEWESAAPPAPITRVLIHGARVLLVPQTFRYEETLPGEEEDSLMAPVRTSVAAQRESVVLLDVPLTPVEVFREKDENGEETAVLMSPVELLSMLDARGEIHLALEPVEPRLVDTTGVNLDSLYQYMSADGVLTTTVTITPTSQDRSALPIITPTPAAEGGR